MFQARPRPFVILALAAGLMAADPADAQQLPRPNTLQGPSACPKGATWQTVPDNAPIKRCATPKQAGCMLADGRRHGPWTVFDVDHACKTRKQVFTYDKGRRTGPALHFITVCATKDRCREQLLKVGAYLDGKPNGQWLILDEQGRKREHYTEIGGVKHGPFSVFNSKGIRIAAGCHQEGKETWRYDFTQKDKWTQPCSTVRKVTKAPVGDGTTKVSKEQEQASKLVRLAQATKRSKLKLMYLRKAVQLVPDNPRYKKLLEAAEAEAAAPESAAPESGAQESGK